MTGRIRIRKKCAGMSASGWITSELGEGMISLGGRKAPVEVLEVTPRAVRFRSVLTGADATWERVE